MTEYLTMSGGGEHLSVLKFSGPQRWQCKHVGGHIPNK